MTAPAHTAAPPPAATDPMRRTARTAGVLYLLTFVSIPTLALYKPVKDHVGTFILGAGSSTGVLWGAASEVVVGLAGIGTAVVLFPVVKRQNETAALGLVTARVVETSLIFVGVISVLSVLTLRSDVAGTAGADPGSLVTTGHTMVAVYTWTFLLSQSLMPVACDLLLGYLLYRSALVPRDLPARRIRRCPAAPRLRHRHLLRRLHQRVPARRPRRAPGRRVRVRPRRLAGRQGLQPLVPAVPRGPGSPQRGSAFDVPAPRQASPAAPVTPSV